MIIEINATVCARGDMTMVSRRQFMIVYSSTAGGCKAARKRLLTRRNKKFKVSTKSTVPSIRRLNKSARLRWP
jgi:hypothetical protein